MPKFKFHTVDVFTEQRFGGNPLAVVMDAEGIDERSMQQVAAEFNFSETTFVLPPKDGSNTARVRIFNRTAEMAFAGHPMVGTAYVLASLRLEPAQFVFEVPAGLVRVDIARNEDGSPIGAKIATPQPLSLGDEIPADTIARCLGLRTGDVIVANHVPMVASMGNPFVIAELANDALARCAPDMRAFRDALDGHPHLGSRFSVHVYAREEQGLRARMFAPLAGTWEDPATGSANAPLAGLLLSLSGKERCDFVIRQGVEMGRPSLLVVSAEKRSEGIFAWLFGKCVPVTQGDIIVD